MKAKRGLPPVAGGSSLLTIFAVLCLVTFTLLALSTVGAQQTMARTSADSVQGYYEADSRAEAVLAALRRGEKPAGVEVNGNVYSFACPISDTQTLEVVLLREGDSYTVTRWQAVSALQWETETGPQVWNGREEGEN